LLYFNSFFSPGFTILPLLLWRIGYWGKPILLLAPRGEFGEGALSDKRRKKRLYMKLFRLLRIHRSIIWHSTAGIETQDIQREWGRHARIVIRPNHTLLPAEPKLPPLPLRDAPRFAFVGRIVERKGLAVALEAIRLSPIRLSFDIYGPEEDAAYVKACMRLAETLPSEVCVQFRGALAPGDVRATLSEYDALLMPTTHENFGHIIAEALSVSCPVLTTPSTPWTETLQAGGGIVVENRDPRVWSEAIRLYASLPAEARANARQSAGKAYRVWRAEPEPPHVWTLALELAGDSSCRA
jgi:glycosyltransferase involved in cell wall biosynthesis